MLDKFTRSLLIATVAMAWSAATNAKVTRVVIEAVEPTVVPGYEILVGRFFGELDPRDPHNRIITDLQYASQNERGRVEYDATFRIARPQDPAKRSGVLLYDVPNRGFLVPGFRNAANFDPGGHLWVASGWQGDLTPAKWAQSITVPVAKGPRGKAIVGPVLARFVKLDADTKSVPISGGLGVAIPRPAPTSLDTARASLWREDAAGVRTAIPARDWAFADCRTKTFPGIPDPRQLCLKAGFAPDAAYTLVYEGRDPLVLGIGFAATRDFVSFLRSGKTDQAGAANPAGTGVRWAIGTGKSQSGNFLRSFVHLGFNADEAGARVFDGINPQIAARQVPLNLRFGVPGGAAGRFEPGSEGTLWWGRYHDVRRGRGITSLLDRCTANDTCPKIIETLGSAEFWGLRLSPNFVGTDTAADIPLPVNVRRYYFPGTAHGGSPGKGFAVEGDPKPGTCLLPGNPNPIEPYLHTLRRALIAWVVEGREPPASRYPQIARGDLVAPNAKALGWPAIPGSPSPDGKINAMVDQYFGPDFRSDDLSGIIKRQPPAIHYSIPSRVPRLNADGNEIAGVATVQLLVPIGTYLGWNVETKGVGAGGGCNFDAGFIPFARTKAARLAKGDPRLSLEERYQDHNGFVARVRAEAAKQVVDGWLSQEDAAMIVRDAAESSVLR